MRACTRHRGICRERVAAPIERDLRLGEAGCHVCHVSCKESVELIRRAKADGVDVTAYYGDDDFGRFKMNPPIRSEEDRLALIQGLRMAR